MHRRSFVAVALAMASALVLAACGGGDGTAPATGGPRIVVTTTVLGDVVGSLVGQDAAVEVLTQPGQDPHAFAASARQVQSLQTADLVIAIGLDLEASLGDVLEAAAGDGVPVLEIAPQLEPDANLDPHVWLDPVRMAAGAQIIAAALAEVDVAAADDWIARGEVVATSMLAIDEDVRGQLADIPPDCRKLVTNHDALGYFAARYDLEIIGSVIPGTSTQADPSARDFAELADLIRTTGVPAIFAESTQSSRLADALAEEVGREVAVISLYTGSLGEPGSGADTYGGMLRTNAARIADALSSC